MLSVAKNTGIINKQQVGDEMEISGRGLIWGTITEFSWRAWGKLRKNIIHRPAFEHVTSLIESRSVNH
jgi:hypothetical protein